MTLTQVEYETGELRSMQTEISKAYSAAVALTGAPARAERLLAAAIHALDQRNLTPAALRREVIQLLVEEQLASRFAA